MRLRNIRRRLVSGMSRGSYQTEVDCDVCPETFVVRFDDPSESFSGTCPNCETHYPELYV